MNLVRILMNYLGGERAPGQPSRRTRSSRPLELELLEERCLLSVGFRWSSSTNTIYAAGPGSFTLTDIKAQLPSASLQLVAPAAHTWLLGSNLKIEQGAELLLHGSSIGGDVDELRMRSNNSSASTSTVWMNADWGTIDIRNTKVTSWDEAANSPDTEYATYKRAYIRVRSSLGADGVTAYESRMDIVDSDVGYLGYDGAEAYGLAWKVAGSQPGLYDKVDVLGDVTNSRIHNNYFGVYTFGGFEMHFLNNEVDHNVKYGLDYHDDSDYLVVEGNWSHHNGNHGIIASQRCDHAIISNNVSEDNTGHGIMLHRSSDDAVVENNQVRRNSDTGIAVMDSYRNTIRGNTVESNRYGIRLSVGSADNLVDGNDVASSTSYGLYFYKGSDAPISGDGHPKRNTFTNNLVHGGAGQGIYLTDADYNTFANNQFFANSTTLQLSRGVGNRFTGNAIPADVVLSTTGSSSVAATTYISNQSGIRVKVDSYSSTIFEDTSGRVFNPGVPGLSTTVTPSGSSLTLTKANIGSTTVTVNLSGLQATTDSGTASVQYVSGTQWKTTASSATQALTYTVGGLTANTTYTVKKDNKVLGTFTTDANGVLSFADVAGSLSVINYTVG